MHGLGFYHCSEVDTENLHHPSSYGEKLREDQWQDIQAKQTH
jgi:hypothetical protein